LRLQFDILQIPHLRLTKATIMHDKFCSGDEAIRFDNLYNVFCSPNSTKSNEGDSSCSSLINETLDPNQPTPTNYILTETVNNSTIADKPSNLLVDMSSSQLDRKNLKIENLRSDGSVNFSPDFATNNSSSWFNLLTPSKWVTAGVLIGLATALFSINYQSYSLFSDSRIVKDSAPQQLKSESAPFLVSENEAIIPDSVANLFNDQFVNAKAYYKITGTFTGWRPNSPMLGASGGPYLILVHKSNDYCYYSGISKGFDNTVKVDFTDLKCSISAINNIQLKLNTLG